MPDYTPDPADVELVAHELRTTVEGGETVTDAAERILDAVRSHLDAPPGRPVATCTHRHRGETVSDLIEFLRAQLADDERAAPLAAEVMALRPVTAGFGARLLREVDAKREIIDVCAEAAEDRVTSGAILADRVLCLLALPYDSHPDYRPEWRP